MQANRDRFDAAASLWMRPSVFVLAAANLVPLGGVLFLRWEVFPILLIFWMENLIVGGFNVLKLLLAQWDAAAKVFLIPFFCLHYGLFCLVHGVLLFALFGRDALSHPGFAGPAELWQVLTRQHLYWAVIGLAISHGISFRQNFLRAGESLRATAPDLMLAPYSRVVMLHGTLLLGGFLVLGLGSPTWALTLLVLLKTGVDLRAHLRERRRFAAGRVSDAPPAPPG